MFLQPQGLLLTKTPLQRSSYSHHACGSPRLLSKELFTATKSVAHHDSSPKNHLTATMSVTRQDSSPKNYLQPPRLWLTKAPLQRIILQPPRLWLIKTPFQSIILQSRLWLTKTPLQRIIYSHHVCGSPRLFSKELSYSHHVCGSPRLFSGELFYSHHVCGSPKLFSKELSYSHHVCGSPRLFSKESSYSHHVCGLPGLLCKELPCKHLVRSSPDSQMLGWASKPEYPDSEAETLMTSMWQSVLVSWNDFCLLRAAWNVQTLFGVWLIGHTGSERDTRRVSDKYCLSNFYVLLTVHLSKIVDNDQLDTHLIYFTRRLL